MGEADYFRHCASINLDILRVYGRRYVIEHVISCFMHEIEERRYRAYITDALMILTENTTKFAGGRHLTKRWADKFIPVETRTAEEIAADIIQNAGLVVQGTVK